MRDLDHPDMQAAARYVGDPLNSGTREVWCSVWHKYYAVVDGRACVFTPEEHDLIVAHLTVLGLWDA